MLILVVLLREEPEQKVAPKNVAPAAADENTDTNVGNNYSRPDGQNVGNFITDRPSSKVCSCSTVLCT